MLDRGVKGSLRPPSVRGQVDRKITRFSLAIGLVAALLTAFVYIASAYPSVQDWVQINQRTLSDITCAGDTCDTSKLSTRWDADLADYVLDTQTRYFISLPPTSAPDSSRFRGLDYSDTAFIARFHQPASYNTPNREVWRLYSREANVGHGNLEIVIGYAEEAPWKMIQTPPSLRPPVDDILKREADLIAAGLSSARGPARRPRSGFSADGYAVVDAATKEVVEAASVPMFLPKETRLPNPGWSLYIRHGLVYLVLTDTNPRILVTSLVPLGRLWWLGGLVAVSFLAVAAIAHALAMRFLRNYFAITARRFPTVEEALRTGEGQSIEFKRGLGDDERRCGEAEDELLKSVAAFANTNVGVIFVGIDDAGHARGLPWDAPQRDRFQNKVHQLVRNRIRPRPPVQTGFDDVRGVLIAKVMVARGEALAYMMGGVIYVRDGSADVQAQPEDLARLMAEYAA